VNATDLAITLAALPRLRAGVLAAARRAGLDRERAQCFAIAVNEVATNTVRHAGGGHLRLSTAPGSIEAEVTDTGPGIPRWVRVGLPAPEALGGRGLWLARTFADRLDIHSDRAGTRVRVGMRRTDGQRGPGLSAMGDSVRA
jgi:anti-sigma regulatory factor (Ser/Thr protein kinase)